ncbi:hypothetical protein Tco_1335546 [Tanacetum coccineum]
MVISDEEEVLVSDDPFKQGRMEEAEDADVEVQCQETFEAELSVLSAAKILTETSKERVKTYNRRRSTDSSQYCFRCKFARIKQQEQERANLEAAFNLQNQFDQERKVADDIDWSKIVEQAQERQSGSMIRYHSFKKKPVTVAQARKNMMVYLKSMANYKIKFFKVREKESCRRSTTSRKLQEVKDSSSFRFRAFSSRKISEEDLKKMLEIVPVEEFREEVLQTKVGNITEAYQGFEDMLKAFDREDLDTLWSLVKEKFRSVEPTEDMERALWVELKRLYEPDKEDTLWKLQRYMHDPLTWKLYGSCAVHHVFSTRGHCIYMLPEKDYPLTTAVMMLMLSRRLQVEEDSEMARDLVKKIFIEANRSRR